MFQGDKTAVGAKISPARSFLWTIKIEVYSKQYFECYENTAYDLLVSM